MEFKTEEERAQYWQETWSLARYKSLKEQVEECRKASENTKKEEE